MLRNPENIKSADQQVHLKDLLAANQSLITVYLMKTELKALWSPTTAWVAISVETVLRLVGERATGSKAVCQTPQGLLARHPEQGTLADARRATGGNQDRIKIIKRMAHGYQDSKFFFMKIKSDFPGNP